MYFLAKYNTQTTFYFAMVKRGVVDLAASADWTPATGDTKISKDGGSFANTTNNPAAVAGTGSVGWSLVLTATELSAAVITIQIVDSATKAVEDQFITIYTYGNASAKIIPDWSDSVRMGLTALPNAAAEAAGGLYTRGTGAGQINQPANGRVDVNAIAMSGTTLTARDIGASVLLSAGSGAGQLDFTSGVVKSNLAQILGTALTETAGQIAAAFKKFFDKATPTGTINSLPDAVPGAAGGLLIDDVWTDARAAKLDNLSGDAYARLGAPAGASIAADIAGVQADTDNIQTRIPAALVSGRIDSSVGAVAANAIDSTAVAASAVTKIRSIYSGTASSGSTTFLIDTSIPMQANNDYRGSFVLITSGSNAGLMRLISVSTLADFSLTFAPAFPSSVSGATFEIIPNGRVDLHLWAGSAASGLSNGNVPASVQEMASAVVTATAIASDAITSAKIANDAIGATEIADGAIDAAALAADMDSYQAKVWVFDDNTGTTDRYVTVWHKNGQPVVSGITSPTIQVIKVSDGTDLVASTAMTQIASTGLYKYNEASNRMASGAAYIAKVGATIDGSTRTWYQPVGRDS